MRNDAAGEMACEEGSPCSGRDVVIEDAYEQQQEGQHSNNNIELNICMQGSSTCLQAPYRTSLTSVAGCLLVHPLACTSAIKVCALAARQPAA